MPVKLNSTGGGSVTIDVPNTGSNFTLTAPANTSTLFTTSGGAITGDVSLTGNLSAGGITTGSLPSGSWTLLNTLTASSSATLSDITNITSTYRTFILLIEGLVPVTNATGLYMQIYSGGAYQTSNYAYSQMIASNYTTQTAQAFIKLSWQNNQVSNVAANGGYNGMVILQNPSQTSFYKQILAHGCNWDTGFAGPLITNVAGTWNGGTGAITGFQLYMSSGNISSGTVRIYGVKA